MASEEMPAGLQEMSDQENAQEREGPEERREEEETAPPGQGARLIRGKLAVENYGAISIGHMKMVVRLMRHHFRAGTIINCQGAYKDALIADLMAVFR